MLEKIWHVILPNLIGLVLIVIGWYISILNVGLTRFQADVLFTKWTLLGLFMIVVGAYLPRAWNRLRGK
jgi:hypothetical protein